MLPWIKSVCICVLSILVLSLFILNAFAHESNLAENPSFEELLDGEPSHWNTWTYDQSPGASEFKVEKGSGLSGGNCAVIVNNKPNDARFIQNVTVEPNSQYKISVWIKSQDIKAETLGANISVYGYLGTSYDVKGTSADWQNVVVYVATGNDIAELPVSIGLGGYGNLNTGAAWFDDIIVEKVEVIPEEAITINVGFPEDNESKHLYGKDFNLKNDSQGKYTWILLVFALIISSGALCYNYFDKIGNKK